MLGFFSSREMAEDFHAEPSTGEQSFAAMADAIHRVFPRAVAQYAHMDRSISRCFRHQLLLRRPEARPRPGRSATGSARRT